jgi:hypothetical protein
MVWNVHTYIGLPDLSELPVSRAQKADNLYSVPLIQRSIMTKPRGEGTVTIYLSFCGDGYTLCVGRSRGYGTKQRDQWQHVAELRVYLFVGEVTSQPSLCGADLSHVKA